jgi:hypothetical protein
MTLSSIEMREGEGERVSEIAASTNGFGVVAFEEEGYKERGRGRGRDIYLYF